MNTPSIKTLMQISGVDEESARKAKIALMSGGRELLDCGMFPETEKYDRSCHYCPSEITIKMVACDEALGTYGVEYISGRNGRSLEYCNAGDAYAATLCFEFERGIFGGKSLRRVFVGCYGDWVERWGKRENAA